MKRFLKYAITLLVVFMLIPMITNSQTIKRSKQKTEQTTKPKQNNDSKKSSKTKLKSTKTDNQKSNSSTSSNGKATQKREKPLDRESISSPRSNSINITRPHVNKNSSSSTIIESIKLDETQTAITLSCKNNLQGGWMNVNPKAYIIANGQKYYLKNATGIKYSPDYTYFDYQGQTLTFTLYFPAVPASSKSIDFIEEESSDWRFYGIQLQSSSSSSNTGSMSSQSTRDYRDNEYLVYFSCNIVDAELYVDGKYVGKANGEYKLKGGSSYVQVKCLGYVEHSAVIDVKSSTSFHYDLIRSSASSAMSSSTLPKSLSPNLVKKVVDDMVFVHGGTFTMGATSEQGKEYEKDETPIHQVTLTSFYICKFEVTQELWVAVMGTNPSNFTGDPNLPVEGVSWSECQIFINNLNKLTGKRFRLPTEAEWEFAARGGNSSKKYKNAGSNKLSDVAWYSDKKTHIVGRKAPNELGLYDMSGNVYEWCQDKYGDYTSAYQKNPTGTPRGSYRVGRGGSWQTGAKGCRVSSRYFGMESTNSNIIGLRLAADSL